MKVNAIRCPNCGDVIYSRHVHDFHYCSCGECAIDGGFDYVRVVAKNPDEIEGLKLEVDATRKELEQDWGRGIDKFGIIKKTNPNYPQKHNENKTQIDT